MNSTVKNSPGKISPSMMCADILNLEQCLRTFEQLKIEYLHIDVMDGSFVPNFTLGTDYVEQLKSATKIPMDIHLMIDRPEDKLEWFPVGEGDYVSFHYEATNHTHRTIERIKTRGAKAMLALNPATPLCVLEDVITDLDAVLIMTVNPGYAGQTFVKQTAGKIRRLRDMYPDIEIEVDGNISFDNAEITRKAGADIFVAGSSSVFKTGASMEDNIRNLRGRIE